jgi:general secretion pathway protein E
MKHAPVVDLVNKILFEAVKVYASDVHFQPYESRLVVRMRIDGVLFDAFDLPIDVQDEAISRMKVIGKMNIAEKRLPQDGRSTVQVGDRSIDLRIASLPTSFGERVVVRLLDKSARVYTLDELGMDRETLDRFRNLIKLEHGLILVTGPTGSGKSTTLYAALQEINSKDRNVVTLEDPIEYQLEGISQTQVSVKKGMTFASGLRSVLRQDPDIIMVGEIRDEETAVMAIQSALTGHLVFSTLHTNDAASAVTRLLDLGIEPYLVSSSLISVMAQRLVRKVCASCSREMVPSTEILELLGNDSASPGQKTIRQGIGCEACRQTGYRGRIGIFELLIVDDAVRQQIQGQSNATTIRDVAVRNGMKLLREDGLAKTLDGMTTVDEVARVTMRTAL